jgi:hypothetical protein
VRNLIEFWETWSDETAERAREAVETVRDRDAERVERPLD